MTADYVLRNLDEKKIGKFPSLFVDPLPKFDPELFLISNACFEASPAFLPIAASNSAKRLFIAIIVSFFDDANIRIE